MAQKLIIMTEKELARHEVTKIWNFIPNTVFGDRPYFTA